jgi:hypothetical protein
MLPNVVIAGAPKCGRHRFAWLADHPVCGSNVKEAGSPRSGDPLFDENRTPGPRLAGPKRTSGSAAKKSKVVLEGTPVYLYQTTAPEALARIEPKPQIVFVFRKPSARVSSHFHFVRDSLVRIESGLTFGEFVRLVEAGDPRIPDYAHANTALSQSRYADYLPAWLARFPRSSIHFFLFEDLRRDPRAFAKAVAARVGLDPDFYDTYAFGRKNTTYRIRRPWLHLARRAVGRRLSPGTRRRLKAATAGAYARINVEPVRLPLGQPTSCASTGRSPHTTSSRAHGARPVRVALKQPSRGPTGYHHGGTGTERRPRGARRVARAHSSMAGRPPRSLRLVRQGDALPPRPRRLPLPEEFRIHEHGLSGYERYRRLR